MSTVVFMMCCAVLVAVPLYFVSHRVYKDGVFGRIGLCGISFFASTFLMEWATGEEYQMMWQSTLLVLSFTVFLTWHLVRFHLRYVLEQRSSSRPATAG